MCAGLADYAEMVTHIFDEKVVAAVLHHMNDDHQDDSLVIVRAHSDFAEAVGAEMTGFDGSGGDWLVLDAGGVQHPVRISWPTGEISERAEVRREVVALYDSAAAKLGLPSREH